MSDMTPEEIAERILDECPLMLCEDDRPFILPDIARAIAAEREVAEARLEALCKRLDTPIAELIDVADVDRENTRLRTALTRVEAEAAAREQAMEEASRCIQDENPRHALHVLRAALRGNNGQALLAQLETLKREWDEQQQSAIYLTSKLAEVDTERLALKEKDAAWEAVANGMADVIRARGEALEPFARFARVYDNDPALLDNFAVQRDQDALITVGDLRWAAEVIGKEE